MTTTVLLIRHGTTQSNTENVYMGFSPEDLSQDGHAQIERLATRLEKTPIAAIYSSPLKRTHTTAARIAKGRNLNVISRNDLTEIDFGSWEGMAKESVKEKWPEIWHQMRQDPGEMTLPDGESFKNVMDRAIRAFEEITAAHPNQCVAIVTHDIIIKMIVLYVLKAESRMYHRFQVDCASITKIISSTERKLITLNDTSHIS